MLWRGRDGPVNWYNQTAVKTIFTDSDSHSEYSLANSTSSYSEFFVPDSCCTHVSSDAAVEYYERCRTQTASDGSN